jgi:hypothetical protein
MKDEELKLYNTTHHTHLHPHTWTEGFFFFGGSLSSFAPTTIKKRIF